MSRIDLDSIFKYSRSTNVRQDADPSELLDSGIGFAQVMPSSKDMVRLIAKRLSAADATDPACSVHDRAAITLYGAFDTAFENGWQPAELVHVTRQCAGGDGTVVMVEAIGSLACPSLLLGRNLFRKEILVPPLDTGRDIATRFSSVAASILKSVDADTGGIDYACRAAVSAVLAATDLWPDDPTARSGGLRRSNRHARVGPAGRLPAAREGGLDGDEPIFATLAWLKK
ncbi:MULTISPECIES: hypothetical protein [unclassified Rhodococcus (in: high G+C Gram-positive bacteria)]|uniref:hypothetical protein n=1 Tax=unclassified Rhodococcus (in: high G+C Gram-positive bacteria) TaxID=192944 RepID=UPI001604A59D|nr:MULTISPECIES: hypothetical protein [unclassified Rhodococcus (in: high G+C Gram-positive bacteria)]